MSSNYDGPPIQSNLPKPWEEEVTFNDVLYDWMDRAPFLAIALLIHVLAFFGLNMFPWEIFEKKEEIIIQAGLPTVIEEPFEELEEEEPEELEEEVIEDPIVEDTEVVEETTDVVENDSNLPEAPFENTSGFNDAIGLGGGAGGGGGGGGGRRAGRKRIGEGINKALLAGLEWLKDHQSDDGSWDVDGFADYCDKDGELCNGEGDELHDVGVTGLALLAFLGFGDTMKEGQYKDVITRGVKWLQQQQDSETGLIGDDIGTEYIYNHAIATLALAEALYGAPNPILKPKVQKAVNYILKARDPYLAWRYSYPSDGDNDTSITGWMVFALKAAKEAKCKVPEDAFRGAVSWFNEVTDESGVTGYIDRGGLSSRPEAYKDAYPSEETHAMTAVAVLCRIFAADVLEEDIEKDELIALGADRLLEKLPVWDSGGGGGGDSGWQEGDAGASNDMYYWYYGSYAMFQMDVVDTDYWKKWKKSMESAILQNQRTSPPCYEGSWDPGGPWGYSGGRVYSTALMVLCLEVYFRYGKVLGARG
ncbi:MAG: prenyltransferase/squalene oxidase repeat-containing protein [Planctomycetota bacterium]|jgi:hypothetical protein